MKHSPAFLSTLLRDAAGLSSGPPRLRAWGHMLRSAAMARLDPRWVPMPHVAYLLVTFRCNCKCRTCNAWQVTGHEDLDTEQWLSLFRQARGLDIVKILGGEPFVRDDIYHILAGVREIIDPYILQVTTNGTDTDAIVDAVREMGWPGLQIRISMDGMEKTHDQMRGVLGTWAQANLTMETLAELRPDLGFRLGINFAIKDESIHEAEAMMDYAARLGADLIPGVNVEPFLDGSVPPEQRGQHFVGLQDLSRALPIIRASRAGYRNQLPGLDRMLSRFITGDVFERQINAGPSPFPCRAMRDIIYVHPNGDVIRCGLDDRPVGNIARQSLDEIWNSQEAQLTRQRVDACPGCLQASIQILSRLYSGGITGG